MILRGVAIALVPVIDARTEGRRRRPLQLHVLVDAPSANRALDANTSWRAGTVSVMPSSLASSA